MDEKLGALISLLAYVVERDLDPDKKEKVEIVLKNSGLSPTKIAQLLGKKPNTVMKVINRSK